MTFPEVGSRWRHYNGGDYVVVGHTGRHVLYADAAKWDAYIKEDLEPGNECQVWARHVDHWEVGVDTKAGVMPRFRIYE